MKIKVIVGKCCLLAFIIVFFSCASRKDIVYFQNSQDFETLVDKGTFSPKFKIDDLVSIHVSTLNEEASAPFNLYQGAQEGGVKPAQVDYLIDKDGEIDFPVIGKIKIAGLSSEEVRNLLREKLSDYLRNPIINIRLKNFTVSVLGEVKRPGTFNVQGERITILEALGFAGDMTIKGRRDNVMIIRDFDGTKVYQKINLTDKNVLNSPFYYLTQNDIVYVEPNNSAISSASLDRGDNILISLVSLAVTTTVILVTRL